MGEPGGLMFLSLGRPVLCLLCWLEGGIFTYGGVGVSVDLLDVGRSNVISEVGRELPLEPERTHQTEKVNYIWDLLPLVIFLLQTLHVLSNVTTENVLLQHLSVQLFAFWVVTWEALLVVRDIESTITSTLESTEYTGAGRGSLETDIKIDLERSGGIFIFEGLDR